jgi:predicted amidohydrolase
MAGRDRLTVGAAQLDTRLGELDANVAKHEAMIVEARRAGVELLVFPETSLTGFPHRPDGGESVHRRALSYRAEALAALGRAAGDMTVVVGFVEEARAAQFYNSCVVLRGTERRYLHRKLNLATYGNLEEGKYFAQGRYVDAFEVVEDVWTASTLICADAWNPALVHLAALHGATLLLVPINSAEGGVSTEFSNPAGWDLASRFYAMIYGMPVIVANRVGTEAGLTFWGGSRIVDPFGEVIAEAPRDEEALISATLDYDAVRRARVQLPTVRDSNLALVEREIHRMSGLLGVPPGVRES